MSAISNLIFNGASHYVTSKFGKRAPLKTSAGKTSSFHNGTDYGTNGKKIAQYAIEDGYCFNATIASDGAKYVWIIYPRIKKAMLHYHLDTISVKKGQAVKKGTKLGTTGKTGKATGIHLHLGIKDLSKLSDTQVKNMTQSLLNGISYTDPEKVSYTAPTKATTTSTYKNFTGYVTANTLNVRSGAGISKSILGTLSKNTAVTITGESGNWYKINYNGKTAYVSKSYITKTKPVTVTYFKKYTGKSVSIDEALKSVCGKSGYDYRKEIATANKISGYKGTAAQNTKMLNLLKQGKLIKP